MKKQKKQHEKCGGQFSLFAHFILPWLFACYNTVNSYNMQLYVYIVFYDHAVDLMLPSPKGKANRLNSLWCHVWLCTWAACGNSPQVHSISGLSLDGFVSSESLFGVDDCESSGLLEKLNICFGLSGTSQFQSYKVTKCIILYANFYCINNALKLVHYFIFSVQRGWNLRWYLVGEEKWEDCWGQEMDRPQGWGMDRVFLINLLQKE